MRWNIENKISKGENSEIGLTEPPGPHCFPKTDDVKKGGKIKKKEYHNRCNIK
jgi:hypothetical protein